MQRKPHLLIFSALLFLYFPGEFFFALSHGRYYSWMDVVLSVVCPVVLLFGLIRVTKVGWYTLVALIALWGVRDLNSYYSSKGASLAPLLMHIGIYTISMAYFINPRIRHLYFDPKLRWWRIKRRFETHMPFLMCHSGQWHYPILRNISEGGCFVESPANIAVGNIIEITIPLPSPLNVSVIKTSGEIRWISKDPLRTGMGIQFTDPPREQQTALREFTHRF